MDQHDYIDEFNELPGLNPGDNEPSPQDSPGLFDLEPVEETIPVTGQPTTKLGNPEEASTLTPSHQSVHAQSATPAPSPQNLSSTKAAELPPLALYRRYRPDTFADVIGQDHVTKPLQRAIINNRVNHAYLFSGPRGCGKTSSARILARCLNCEQGPTPNPCGQCQSCRDLSHGGLGSIDVIEIDAASHGGVDDARDLRERAFFAPVHSRYKIYIVDEAHMVSTAGFNALLKLVEEPPPHVKFIFATTEPEKVIGTIRSRTHHYPFRLVPPRILTDYLAHICATEEVAVESSVLPLVVRAGAGSVRDSLSVLDQLLGSADENGLEYRQAAALLGYTPDTLLDQIVTGFATHDSATVFATIDKAIEIGQDPRRFTEDLLRRLRDLIMVAAVPEAAAIGLLDIPDDQAERFATQVAQFNQGELTRAAELVAAGLTEMRGTTAPRLNLELLCARVLLPGADFDLNSVSVRLERLEQALATGTKLVSSRPSHINQLQKPVEQVSQTAGQPLTNQHPADAASAMIPTHQRPAEPTPPTVPTHQRPAEPTPPTVPTHQRPAEPTPSPERPASPQQPATAAPKPAPAKQRPTSTQTPVPPPASTKSVDTSEPVPPSAEAPTSTKSAANTETSLILETVLAQWERILDLVKERRRFTWMVLSNNSQVVEISANTITLGFTNPGARESLIQRGNIEILHDALLEVFGLELNIVTKLQDDPPENQLPVSTEHHSPDLTTTSAIDDTEGCSPDDEEVIEESLSLTDLLAKELGAEIISEEPIE